jgi:hypothetical protein
MVCVIRFYPLGLLVSCSADFSVQNSFVFGVLKLLVKLFLVLSLVVIISKKQSYFTKLSCSSLCIGGGEASDNCAILNLFPKKIYQGFFLLANKEPMQSRR